MVRCFQNADMNSLSWSDMISLGRPFSQYQWSKKRILSSLALSEVEVGMIRISDPRRSVIVSMQLWPLSVGRGPMKFMDTESHRSSGTGRGCRGPVGFFVELLLR